MGTCGWITSFLSSGNGWLSQSSQLSVDLLPIHFGLRVRFSMERTSPPTLSDVEVRMSRASEEGPEWARCSVVKESFRGPIRRALCDAFRHLENCIASTMSWNSLCPSY